MGLRERIQALQSASDARSLAQESEIQKRKDDLTLKKQAQGLNPNFLPLVAVAEALSGGKSHLTGVANALSGQEAQRKADITKLENSIANQEQTLGAGKTRDLASLVGQQTAQQKSKAKAETAEAKLKADQKNVAALAASKGKVTAAKQKTLDARLLLDQQKFAAQKEQFALSLKNKLKGKKGKGKLNAGSIDKFVNASKAMGMFNNIEYWYNREKRDAPKKDLVRGTIDSITGFNSGRQRLPVVSDTPLSASINAFTEFYGRDVSGAAIAKHENVAFARLMPYINDTKEVADLKMGWMKKILRTRLEFLAGGGKIKDAEAITESMIGGILDNIDAGQALAPIDTKDAEKMSDAELDAAMKARGL